MRKLFRKQILLLTVLAVFFGCTANGGSKDIVKGLIDVATKSGVAQDKAGASTVDIAAADPDGLKVVKVNINFDAELAEQYAVQAAPTLVFFQNGAEVARLRGLVKKAELTEVIDSLKK